MANLDKIRVIKDGVSTDYDISGGTSSEVELPIDYNSVYDTEEHQVGWYAVTGGYKPLYRRKIDFNILLNTSNVINVPYNEYISNAEYINIDYEASYIQETNGRIMPLNYSRHDEIAYQVGYGIDAPGKQLIIFIGKLDGGRTLKTVTFIYTKTTDTVVAEIPKQTIPAVVQKEEEIYSTTEQRIGTWIDRKTVV